MYINDEKLELSQYKVNKNKVFNIMKVLNKIIHHVSGERFYVNSVLKPYIQKWLTYRDFSLKVFNLDDIYSNIYLEVKGKSQHYKPRHRLNIYFSIDDVVIAFNVITLCKDVYFLQVRYTADKDRTTPEAIGNIVHLCL